MTAAWREIKRRWDGYWFAPGDALTLGVCRALFFGGLFLWQMPHDFSPWGAYSSVFWMPIWLFDTAGIPAFSATTITVLQSVWKASLLLSAIGLFGRSPMLVAFAIGTYLMGLPQNFGQTQHFDTLVVFASGALALSQACDGFSLDAWRRTPVARQAVASRDRGEYTWPIKFVWVAMSAIFCAAGISKLRHSGVEWFLSDSMSWLLLRQQYHISDGEPLTRWGIWIANHPFVAHATAASAVAIETSFPLALVNRRLRAVLVPSGLLFLVGIRALMGPTFEQFMMCYVFWIPWGRLVYSTSAARIAIGATRRATTIPSIATSAGSRTRSGRDRPVAGIGPAASATRQAAASN